MDIESQRESVRNDDSLIKKMVHSVILLQTEKEYLCYVLPYLDAILYDQPELTSNILEIG